MYRSIVSPIVECRANVCATFGCTPAAAGRRAEEDAGRYDWETIARQTEAVYRAALDEAR